MADSFTTNCNFTLPEVGASTDTWGTKNNADWSQLDAFFGPGPVLLLASGGTGANTASAARFNLGCGTMATQNSSTVSIGGGTATGLTVAASTIDACPVGSSTASTGRFTTLQISVGALTFADGSSQATSAGSLNSPTVSAITSSGTCSSIPIFLTEKVDCTGGAVTRIIPSAVGITGHVITLKKMDSTTNGLNWVTTSGQTVDQGAGSGSIFRQFDAVSFQSDGSNWILT